MEIGGGVAATIDISAFVSFAGISESENFVQAMVVVKRVYLANSSEMDQRI